MKNSICHPSRKMIPGIIVLFAIPLICLLLSFMPNHNPAITSNIKASSIDTAVSTDPIKFTITSTKTIVKAGEDVELLIAARFLNTAGLMYYLPGSNAYTIKLLLPEGFIQTGGDLYGYASDVLTQSKGIVTYRVRGSFSGAQKKGCFRLIRSHGGAGEHSRFSVSATYCLQVQDRITGPDQKSAFNSSNVITQYWCGEAESGTGNRGVDNNSQASGGQCVGGFGNSSEYMQYTVTGIPAAGNYTLSIWYTSGETPQIGIVVNSVLQTTSASTTGSWSGPFVEKTVTVSLNSGNNTIRIQGNGGQFVIDKLCVSGESSCLAPTLTLGSPNCSGTSTYSVGFTAQSGSSVTSSAGSVSGSQVINIPTGTNVTVTATLSGCSTQQTASSPSCGSTGGVVSGKCYVIKSKQTVSSNNTLQAIGSQVLFRPANSQSDQIWKATSAGSAFYFTSQAGSANQTMYVNGFGDGQGMNLGTYNANDRYQWNLVSSSSGGYRVHGGTGQNTWDQAAAGYSDGLQLYGTNTNTSDGNWDQPYRRFSFDSVGCPSGCSAPTLTLGTATCSGTSTYSVSFTAQSGSTVTSSTGTVSGSQVINIPAGTGVTVTATLSGCSTQQTAGSPNCGSPGGFNYPIPSTPSSWPSYNSDVLSGSAVGDVAILENSDIKIEVRKRYGGAIQIIDKASGKKLVNFADWGRQDELSIYSGPANFSAGGWAGYDGIGWNPLTVGDIYGNGAPVLAWGFVTGNDGMQRIYVKTKMINWPTNNVLMDAINERWYGVNGKEVDVKARVTFNRTDQTFYEPAVPQEYPCFMRSGKNTLRYYNGNAPYTNGSYVTSSNMESNGTAFGGGHFMISEPWISQEQGGLHIFINTDKLALASSTGYDYQYSSTDYEGAFQATYATPGNVLVVDPHDTWYHNYGFYITTDFSAGRTWANSRPRKYGNVPDFNFTAANGRNDWHVGKGYDQGQPFTGDGWNCTLVPSQDGGPLTARRSSICSPYGSWKASNISTLYVRLKYTGQENQFRISFRRNGQAEIPYNSSKPNQFADWYPNGMENGGAQSFNFTPIKDGQYHTYTINCSANSEWKDVIQYFQINYGNGSEVIPQESVNVLYFGANNPGN